MPLKARFPRVRFMDITHIPFQVTALLGKTSLPLTSYLELQIGDILVLNQPIDQGLVVLVGKQERFRATAGLYLNHKAITLDEPIHSR